MVTEEQKVIVLDSVSTASRKWKDAFNSGDAAECAAQYEDNAVMNAKPFGIYTGTTEIKEFWQKLIHDGFSDVDYIDPIVEVVDERSAILKSGWKMNKAAGVIHKELWIIQSDGTAKLREDDFEAQG